MAGGRQTWERLVLLKALSGRSLWLCCQSLFWFSFACDEHDGDGKANPGPVPVGLRASFSRSSLACV